MGRREAPPSDVVEITVHNSRRGAAADGSRSGERRRSEGKCSNDEEFRPFRRWPPVLMPTFIAVNVLLFAISMYVNNCPKNSSTCVAGFLGRFSFQPLKENPLFGPSAATLLKMGALEVSKVTYDHEAWRLITCMWLHAGFIHLVSNMLSLVFIGIRLEQEFGFLRIGPLYIISGIGGSLMSALFIESTISVGASGALFGLLGAMLSELITNWTIYANKFAALLTLVVIIGINLAVGFLPHVDNFAHIGGFITGFLLGFVLLIRPQFGYVSQKNVPIGYHASAPKKPKYKTYQYILWGISIALLIIGFIVGLVLLFGGFDGHKPCSWCHYLSCVPTSSWSCNKSSKSVSCMSSQIGYQWNLTCSDSGKTKNYLLKDATDAQILELCTQLCT